MIPININAVNHNTPFVGPAGTMSLPNPGNDVYLDGALIVISVVAPAAVGLGTALVGLGVDLLTFLDSNPPSPLPPSGGNANVAPGPQVALVKDRAGHGSHAGKTWWVGSAPGSNFSTIQSAIDSPSVRSGDTIKVEPGTYADATLPDDTVTVDESLTILGGQSFPGANQHGASIVTSDGVGFTLAANDIAIEDFTIRTATLPRGTAGIATAAGFLGSGYQIRDNLLEDETSGLQLNTQGGKAAIARIARVSIRLPRGPAALIRRGTNRRVAAPAIELQGSSPLPSAPTLVADPRALARHAADARGRRSLTTVSGNTFVDNADGVSSDVAMNSIAISANTFTGDTSASVAVAGSSQSSNVQVMDNQVTNDAAIVLQNATSSTVEGNHIVNPHGGNGDGIWLDGGVTRTVVERNSLVGGPGSGNGVDSSGAGNASDTISRNTVMDFARGIRLNAASGDTVLDNTVQQNNSAGIDVANGADAQHGQGRLRRGELRRRGDPGCERQHDHAQHGRGQPGCRHRRAGLRRQFALSQQRQRQRGGRRNPHLRRLRHGLAQHGRRQLARYRLDALHEHDDLAQFRGCQHAQRGRGTVRRECVGPVGQGRQQQGREQRGRRHLAVSLDPRHRLAQSGRRQHGLRHPGPESGEADTYDTISHNTADNNRGGAGISLVNDDATSVTRNTAKSNGVAGIGTRDSNGDTITGNKT